MNREDACTALGLPDGASGEEIEAAYRAKHNDLQQRILQAPVEGLKTKYREELRRVEQAREVLRQGRPANPEDLPALRPAYESRSPAAAAAATGPTREHRPSAQPRKGGSGKYIVVATLILLAGAGFVYLTQAGPLQGWWRESLRDQALVSEIEILAGEIEFLARDWEELRSEIHGEEPSEIDQARRLAERGREHLSRLEDGPARTAYSEAKALWEDALEAGRKQVTLRRTENLDRARAEGEKVKAQMERLKRAERAIEEELRDAKSLVRSLEGRAGGAAEELRPAQEERTHLEEYEEISRRLVFEGERLSTARGLSSRAESQLRREDGKAALSSFEEAEQVLAGLVGTLSELKELLREVSDAKRELGRVRASVPAPYRSEFSEAEELIRAAAASVREGELDSAKARVREVRAATMQGRERALAAERLAACSRDLRAAEDELMRARASVTASHRSEFAEAEGLLQAAASSFQSGDLDSVREGIRRARESWTEGLRNVAAAERLVEYESAMARAKGLLSSKHLAKAKEGYAEAERLAGLAGVPTAAAREGLGQVATAERLEEYEDAMVQAKRLLSSKALAEAEQAYAEAERLAGAAGVTTAAAREGLKNVATARRLAEFELGSGYAYGEATEAAFRKLLKQSGWSRAQPLRNSQGMLRAMHDRTGLVFVLIPAGSFQMGSPGTEDERDEDEVSHPVTIGRPFLLCETECTQGAWERGGGRNGSQFKGVELPVEHVNWKECHDWCARNGFRLPSEAEWEYSCRAGATTPFSFGGTISPSQVNYCGVLPYADSPTGVDRRRTIAARSLLANPWGIFEMHGNVFEWCEDWYGPYSEAPSDGSARTLKGESPGTVYRGGCWSGAARCCRSALRLAVDPVNFRASDLGFRPAISLP